MVSGTCLWTRNLKVTSFAMMMDKVRIFGTGKSLSSFGVPFVLVAIRCSCITDLWAVRYSSRDISPLICILTEATKLEHDFKNGGRNLKSVLRFVLLFVSVVTHMRLNATFHWIILWNSIQYTCIFWDTYLRNWDSWCILRSMHILCQK
jgi:hypothetical protein